MIKLARFIGFTLAVGSAVVAAGACASSPATRSSTSTASRMDTTEFRRPEFRTLYDAIKARRPDWLLARGGVTNITNGMGSRSPTVGVFFEGESRGYPLEKLQDLVGGDVKSVRRINGTESLATYGSEWPWGGIVITRAR
ncbi:MAG TPA: hypothetical protein VIP11_13320 [Gemmatimonadaceae bacterium]